MSQLLAGLAGAIVAFGGTWLLQRARFVREDRDGVRERLGIARALLAELQEARLQVDSGVKRGAIPNSTRFTVVVWHSHAHRLIAALTPHAWTGIVDAFVALSGSNTHLAAIPPEKTTLTLEPGSEMGDAFAELQAKVVTAYDILVGLNHEYAAKETAMRRLLFDKIRGRNRPH
jgi:hypothetical protein